MTSERSEAYGRLMWELRSFGPTALLPQERDQIREAADAMLFCEDPAGDDDARRALDDASRLIEGLVALGRWRRHTAVRLTRELEACGPLLGAVS